MSLLPRARKPGLTAGLLLLTLLGASCSQEDSSGEGMTGEVRLDGSSTVYPISEAIAEEFLTEEARVRVTVGVSGTGGGFQKFTNGETDINNASREISEGEAQRARENGIDFLEIPVAFDGLSVIVNDENDWVDHLTVEELRRIWEPGSNIDSWDDIRPQWPERELRLYGPGTDSGTFDYFTEVIVGDSGAARPDYTASEDDNVLVQGIRGDRGSLGFFGYAYYLANQDRLKLVPIDSGEGPVAPSEETINNNAYNPLSRPVFIYVSKQSLERPEVRRFVEFYLDIVPEIAAEVGYVPMPEANYQEARQELADF